MIKVSRLDDPKVLTLINRDNIDKVFLDIDYTVLNFGNGNQWAIKKLNSFYPKLGDELNKIFNLNLKSTRDFSSLSAEELGEYEKNLKLIEKLQSRVLLNYKVRLWARSSMIMIAAGKIGLNLDFNEVKTVTNIYWKAIAKKGNFYEDALCFLNKIKSERIEITWVTGSDSILMIGQNNGQIELNYNPEYSRKEKEKRLVNLIKKYPGKLVIGDPVDKPEVWEILLEGLDVNRILVVGDAYDADLKPAERRGIKTILISR
jgi:hypothetical protein